MKCDNNFYSTDIITDTIVRESPIFTLESIRKWTPDLAYILGFTYADGYMVRTDNNKHDIPYYRLGWHLSNKDMVILERFKEILKLDQEITTLKDGSIDLRTTDQKICLTMLERGVLLNKTKRLSTPDMPNEMYKHFIRGYFDGDGSVYLREQSGKTWLSVNIVGASKVFLEDIGNILKRNINLIPKIRCYGTYWRLDYNNMESAAFYRWIYDYPNFNILHLERNRDVFEKWLNNNGGLNYGLAKCPICSKEFTRLADRSKMCKSCKPLAAKYYSAKHRTYNWKMIQSELISNNKIT